MVIDAHYHPAFFSEVCPSETVADKRRQSMAYYKTPIQPIVRVMEKLNSSGVDKCFLLPHDYSTITGDRITNEEMQKLVAQGEGRFYGFASVDPHQQNHIKEVEIAYKDLGCVGLKLHPSRQKFYPMDEELFPLYELCIKFNKPIIFHAGFTWQPDAPAKYSHPMNFEELAIIYPTLRFCLAHMGFPWVKETAMLLNKYPNIYSDTAILYFDSAREFYEQVFTKEMSTGWLDRSIRHQVMFGSNTPRWEQMRMLTALKNLGLRDETFELITHRNALEFIGEEEANWLS